MMTVEIGIGLTTFPDILSAKSTISKLLVENLISCAQIDKEIESHYIWKGEVRVTTEVRVMVKFNTNNAEKIETVLLKLHPYDTPEWVRWEAECSYSYAEWIRNPN